MQTPTKTTVQIIQELISLRSAKIEKLTLKNATAEQNAKENDPVLKKLLNELSQHGDAAGSTVEKTDPYYDTQHHDESKFQIALDNLLKQSGELPESVKSIIQTMINK